MRSTFHEWKNSCEIVSSRPTRLVRIEPCARDDRAVAMLHAVAVRPRQVVGDERVGVALERRDTRRRRGRASRTMRSTSRAKASSSASVPVWCTARRTTGEPGRVGDGEGPQAEGADLRGTVHQVLQVRRGEGERVAARQQLRADAPARRRRRRRSGRSTGRSSKPRAHISAAGMLMCACVLSIAEVGAVDAIAEDPVGHAHGAVVSGDVPLVRIRARDRQRRARGVGHAHVEDVLGELVQRVAAGRRAAHAQLAASPPAARRSVTSTSISRCSASGNESRYSTGACARAAAGARRTRTARRARMRGAMAK